MPDLNDVRDQLRRIQRQLEDASLDELPHTQRLHRLVTASVHEATDAILLGPSCLPPNPAAATARAH